LIIILSSSSFLLSSGPIYFFKIVLELLFIRIVSGTPYAPSSIELTPEGSTTILE